jgi:hypothetical protein
MNDAIGIGYFQFDNLVRSRVPFCLFRFEVSLAGIYKGPELEHIDRYGIACERSFATTAGIRILEERRYRTIDPVLVICSDGVQSKKWADELSRKGYINCYFVEGGLAQLETSSRDQR